MRADHEIVVAWVDRQIAYRHRRQIPAFVMRPLLAAIHRDPQPELRPEEQQVGVDQVFLNHVRVTAHGTIRRHECRPRFPKVGRAVGVGTHVPERMDVERGVDGARSEVARLHR